MQSRPSFRVYSIGVVRRGNLAAPEPGDFYDPWQETTLEIDERWEAGLDGLEEFSHLVVLFYLDRASRRRVAGASGGAESKAGVQPVGFFATRTPRRPNPIGIACPRLIRREGHKLIVTGIDAWPGTPILDIKGYYPRDEQRPDATIPSWLETLWAHHDAERPAFREHR